MLNVRLFISVDVTLLHGDRIRTDIANMFFELVEMNVDSTHEMKDFESFRAGYACKFGYGSSY